MLKVFILLILLSFPLLLIIYFRSLKKSKLQNLTIEPIEHTDRIDVISINKTKPINRAITNNLLIDISTIIKRDDFYDILITFDNYLGKHVRIDIDEILLYTDAFNNGLEGDFSFQDLTLGTNDYILKNTIIDGGNLIRNVHFRTKEIINFSGEETITIKLKINNEPFKVKTSINESTVKEVKFIFENKLTPN